MHLYIYEHVRTNIHIHSITCWNLIVSKVWSICTMLQWSAFLLMNFICIAFYEENHRDLDSNPLILFILWAFNFEVPTISCYWTWSCSRHCYELHGMIYAGLSVHLLFLFTRINHCISLIIKYVVHIDTSIKSSELVWCMFPIAWLWVIILVCLLEKTITGFKRN
jgi:hypothetical protein